jgi:uncharacterized protein
MVTLARNAALLLAVLALARSATTHAATPRPRGRGPMPEKVVDQGTFVVTVAGRRAGQEAFSIVEIGREREIRTTTVLGGGKVPTRVTGTLRTDQHWQPLRGHFEVSGAGPTRRMSLERSGAYPELVTHLRANALMTTRPGRASDVFLLNQDIVLAHLAPLCELGGARERTLTAFPGAPLRLSPTAVRPYPQTRAGAPVLELRALVADLAQHTRFELVCDGPRLLAVHQRGRQLTAVRASFEAVAAALDARAADKPGVPATVVELPREVVVPAADGQPAARLGCALTVPRSHAEVKKQAGAPRAAGALVATPAALAPLPGVVLLGDSGTQDRDGDPVGPGDPNLSLLKTLAMQLADAGVASLRCDDRGAAARPFARPGRRPGLQALVADARALVAALRKEPAVDPARAGVLGQGEGGLIAAMVAERDRKLQAVALLATAGRPLDRLMLDQSEATLRRFGYPEPEIAAAIAEQRATYEALRRGTALPATLSAAERQGVRDASSWLRSHLATDPAVVVGRLVEVPVLLLQGGKDARVSSLDFERLRLALEGAGNQKVTARFHAELTHPFAPARTSSLSDYLDPQARVSEEVMSEVASFFRRTLGGETALAAAAPAAAPPRPSTTIAAPPR